MSQRLHPIPFGTGVLLVPDSWAPPTPVHDERIVRPTGRRRGDRRA
jgi:hypothetical protein